MTRAIVALALAAASLAWTGGLHADEGGFHLRLGARALFGLRRDEGYFDHARVFVESPSTSTRGAHLIGDPVPPAGGIVFEAGAEVVPRLSLMASFRTMTNGIKTGDDTRLSITSTAWLVDARYAIVRAGSEPLLAQLELVAGTGRFSIREELVDRALFDGTKAQSATALGGRFGLDATLFLGPVGFVVGYAYDVAPASVHDRLGGSVDASAHELTVGLAARF